MSPTPLVKDVQLRRLSKVVFGQELRIPVMLAVGRHHDGIFCLSDIAEAVGVRSPSSVQDPLKALQQAGLIERQEGLDGEKHRWYRRTDSLCWAWVEELADRVQAAKRSNPARRSG